MAKVDSETPGSETVDPLEEHSFLDKVRIRVGWFILPTSPEHIAEELEDVKVQTHRLPKLTKVNQANIISALAEVSFELGIMDGVWESDEEE